MIRSSMTFFRGCLCPEYPLLVFALCSPNGVLRYGAGCEHDIEIRLQKKRNCSVLKRLLEKVYSYRFINDVKCGFICLRLRIASIFRKDQRNSNHWQVYFFRLLVAVCLKHGLQLSLKSRIFIHLQLLSFCGRTWNKSHGAQVEQQVSRKYMLAGKFHDLWKQYLTDSIFCRVCNKSSSFLKLLRHFPDFAVSVTISIDTIPGSELSYVTAVSISSHTNWFLWNVMCRNNLLLSQDWLSLFNSRWLLLARHLGG